MRVQCVICDTIEELVDDTLEAKRLRNRPIHTHMCKACHNRITERTKERLATGSFHFFRSSRRIEDDF
ncbi:YlaI family protein [Planococcus liqunii]|uniref:YlaI family protein n=1 Tax=Planococcus liqunii TaxID=3058394 RepID=A0ABT8MMG7_9BACL|nr:MULTISPECIES: YlaI family protein [unclassified Planococcus (in: firmicutes)]MDN7226077.1 YlaI family protein [Planococcus sp. N064]WKA49864.1 YlaI family protein [Planococcus sp. N056]